MVSKVAVIALVAIVAIPILLGYAMNVTEVTETDYRTTGEQVNVTPLLQQDTEYSYTHADIYDLNTKFLQTRNTTQVKVFPYYEISTVRSSFPIEQYDATGAGSMSPRTVGDFQYLFIQSNYPQSGGYLRLHIIDTINGYPYEITRYPLHTVCWDADSSTITYSWYTSLTSTLLSTGYYTVVDPSLVTISCDSAGGAVTGTGVYDRLSTSGASTYADFAKGYKLYGLDGATTSIKLSNSISLDLPLYPKDVLFTLDLNSFTDANYTWRVGCMDPAIDILTFTKTTVGSDVTWIASWGAGPTRQVELYYDESRSSNTYQVFLDTSGGSLRYVGDWPTIIGEANYYQNYEFDWVQDYSQSNGLNSLFFFDNTPKIRIDDATYRAFEFPILNNTTYAPADFKTNPVTTIGGNMIYGDSLTFGGNTYTVTNGNITLGTHQISVNGLKLSSVLNENGTYDNKIGNTVISTTATPSTITFNGKWSASITTQSQESYSVTKTEWIAGSFGWDGIDHNFLLVGLLTSFAAFIGCGIYAKKTGSGGIIPVMIVCGGAALMFFLML